MDLFAGAGFAGATRESCVFPASDLLFRRCRGGKPGLASGPLAARQKQQQVPHG